MKYIKNITESEIYLQDVGVPIPAGATHEINEQEYGLWHAALIIAGSPLKAQILSGDLVVNDGINDITVAGGFDLDRAVDYLRHSDWAFNNRFLSEPERSNGFVSNNVQEAIEESKAAIEGKVSVLPTFLNNGLTKNKWLALDGAMESSDMLPAITAYDSRLASITFVNDKDDTDTDLEFYVNGVLVYTWEIRNKRYAWKSNGLSGVVFSRGDRISCFAKQASGTGVDPSSVIVFVNVQTINSVNSEGGGVTL